MNTAKLRRFATEARTKIKQGVVMMMRQWGFDADGNVLEEPIKIDGGTIFRGKVIGGENVYTRWEALRNRIATAGLKQVYEEASYTWFNRFVAIKILSKNGLLDGFLDNVEGKPVILSQARRNAFPLTLTEDERRKALELAGDHEREFDLFTFLITSVCHSTPILANCFGKINDYTELLLPRSILTQGDFIEMLNDDEYISDDDYRQAELIGWLYQFYIAERKDEVFASFKSGKKAAKEDIPAATQIFTPNWIVKYMVQNTIGRIYLDNFPDSELASKWKYLVEPAEGSHSEENILKIENPEELTLADKGCGSGHILVEGFDVLFDIYKEQYASDTEACESILKYNLVGVDIDTRAKQLAQFALLMKACKHVPEMADCHIMPQVYDMPEPLSAQEMDSLHDSLPHFFLGGNEKVISETIGALTLLQQAQDLGSVMKFNVSESTRYAIETALKDADSIFSFIPHLRLMLDLTRKYASLCMNPPYMGAGNMNVTLNDYVKLTYPKGKSDLATVFVEMMPQTTLKNGKYAFIIPPSWMFLSTSEELRKSIFKNQSIDSLLHLSRGVFGADFGASSAVITNSKNLNAAGAYFRLIERTFQEFDQKHLQQLFEKTLINKNFRYNFADYRKDIKEITYYERGSKIFFSNVRQANFEKVPGCPFGYWQGPAFRESFSFPNMAQVANPRAGLATGDNNIYQRYWHEVSIGKIGFNYSSVEDTEDGQYKWFPCNSGGTLRKWSCNNQLVVNWEKNGKSLRNFKNSAGKIASRPQNTQYYFKEGLTWNKISSSNLAVKYKSQGFIFDDTSRSAFVDEKNKLIPLIGLLCSCVTLNYLKLFNPTMSFTNGDIARIPVNKDVFNRKAISSLVNQNISISRQDWDSHETSWDFNRNELLTMDADAYTVNINYQIEKHFKETGEHICIDPAAPRLESIKWRTEQYHQKWERLFLQLHTNEEELNRQFIEIYGLQDELTPDVPLSEITILQQGEITIEDNTIVWHDDLLMKQLISYAIGCFMGRYRLDKGGLHIAHPAPTEDEIAPYEYNGETFSIDDDGILPILPEDAPFTDNTRQRMIEFIAQVFGQESQVENLNYIESALGKSLGDYLIKDFWKDHKKMYQNRPIYWLFTSKKGAFQCIAYMHRMDEYTLERIRQKYLLPYISHLESKAQALQARESLSTAESRQLTKLKTTIDECREYHDRLHQYSQQNIAFDIDDGVVKNYALFGDVVAKLK